MTSPETLSGKGFTLIELLIVIAVTMVLAAAATPIYGNLQVSSQLNESSSLLIQTLRTAKSESVSRYNNSAHGVNIENNRYILYQGQSYFSRDVEYDRVTNLEESLILSSNLSGLGDIGDINFSKSLGVPNKTGTLTLTHSAKGSRVVSINGLGKIEEE